MPRSVKDSECYLPIQMDNLMVRAEKGERAMWTASREDRAHEKNLSTHNCGTMFSDKRYSFQLFVDMSATGEETWGHNEPKTRVLWGVEKDPFRPCQARKSEFLKGGKTQGLKGKGLEKTAKENHQSTI